MKAEFKLKVILNLRSEMNEKDLEEFKESLAKRIRSMVYDKHFAVEDVVRIK